MKTSATAADPFHRRQEPRLPTRRAACAVLVMLFGLGELAGGMTRHAAADEAVPQSAAKPKRVLLISQGPDGHPAGTHEYVAGTAILARLLNRPGLQLIPVRADGEWEAGPELLDGADGVVLFVSQGAFWLSDDQQRLAAFRRLAARGGGLSVLHWGMGTKSAEPVRNFVSLFGGCHGGPDRRYRVAELTASPADRQHPVLQGIPPFEVHDEFYYRLKFVSPREQIIPLLKVPLDGEQHTVAWGWKRPDGGRSFGFSGFHFHRNWQLPEYQRLAAQGVLWTLDESIPQGGLDPLTDPAYFTLPDRDQDGDR